MISYTGDGTGLVGGTDGTSVHHLGHLRWTTYNRERGVAKGLVWLDDCEPNCAEGTFHCTPVSVHVGSPKHGRFRRLTLIYNYRGKNYTDRRRIHHSPSGPGYRGSWYYEIL